MRFVGLAHAGLLALAAAFTTAKPVPDVPDSPGAALAARDSHIAKRTFLSSCFNARVPFGEPSQLVAECLLLDKTTQTTTLNLNNCVTNNGGFLSFKPDGKFDETCTVTGFAIRGGQAILEARCTNRGSSSTTLSRLNLIEKIHNDNGNLLCRV